MKKKDFWSHTVRLSVHRRSEREWQMIGTKIIDKTVHNLVRWVQVLFYSIVAFSHCLRSAVDSDVVAACCGSGTFQSIWSIFQSFFRQNENFGFKLSFCRQERAAGKRQQHSYGILMLLNVRRPPHRCWDICRKKKFKLQSIVHTISLPTANGNVQIVHLIADMINHKTSATNCRSPPPSPLPPSPHQLTVSNIADCAKPATKCDSRTRTHTSPNASPCGSTCTSSVRNKSCNKRFDLLRFSCFLATNRYAIYNSDGIFAQNEKCTQELGPLTVIRSHLLEKIVAKKNRTGRRTYASGAKFSSLPLMSGYLGPFPFKRNQREKKNEKFAHRRHSRK